MGELGLALIGIMLAAASLVAMLCRRLGMPYTAGLVLAGLVLAYLPIAAEVPLSRELIFSVFLPPLIFEAALQLRWDRFREQLPLTLSLAFPGLALSALLVAAGMHFLLGWGWLGAAFFAVLIAATDPVSVIAAFKELKAEPRLGMVVEAESLLNDGVAAVGFAILMGIAAGGAVEPIAVGGALLWTVFGGVIVGAAIAFGILLVAGRTTDHLVEVTLTTVIAWSAFLIAEYLHASGVFAALVAGLIVGNYGTRGSISEAGRQHVHDFWEYAAFLANSCLFLMIGVHEAHQPIAVVTPLLAGVILLTLIGRAVAVYPIALLFSRSKLRLPATYQHVLVWGGLRGAVGLALALTVPASVPERGAIIVLTFGVVAFSVFAQGMTIPSMLHRWRLTQTDKPKA